jgi:hypothetical protein
MHGYLTTSIALDDRIDEFGELIKEHYNIAELGDPSTSTDVRLFPALLCVYNTDMSVPSGRNHSDRADNT